MRAFPLLLLPVLWTACDSAGPQGGDDAGWRDIPNAHASSFQLSGRGDERRAIVFGPGGRGDTLAVYHVGGDGKEGHAGTVVLPALDRVAVASTTHLPFFRALGRAGTVAGIAHRGLVRDTLFRTIIARGGIAEIATADGTDKERLIALAPHALFDHPFGRSSAGAEAAPGIPTILVTEYLEEHPLGRAEWLRFFGALLGEEARADSLFGAIRERYMEAMVREDGKGLPLAFLGSSWQGQWFAPPAGSHMAVLIADAGGRYAITSGRGANVQLDIETVIGIARRADHFGVVLSEDRPVTEAVLTGGDERLMGIPSLREGGFHANGAVSDLFGEALLEPDILLRDLRCIFHPSRCGDHQARYFFPTAR